MSSALFGFACVVCAFYFAWRTLEFFETGSKRAVVCALLALLAAIAAGTAAHLGGM